MRKLAVAIVMVSALTAWAIPGRAADVPADNSGKNVRDRQGATQTPPDQSNAKADMAITQAIRKAVVADKGLSTNAHNVKIIAQNGMVTLKGPVNSDSEKQAVEAKAAQIAGADKVSSDIQVRSK
jgi:hyperosmotically inducible protein